MDAKPRDDVAHLLMMHRKLSDARRDHALQTLALITGRADHREKNGREHAQEWLSRHGK
jgi:hypothetical protein